MKPHYHVVIATPGRMFHAEYVKSLVETMQTLVNKGLQVKFLNKYTSFVPTARELTAIDSWSHDYSSREIGRGEFTYDKIFWIDSDIEWTVEDFMKLYESEHDVISDWIVTPSAAIATGRTGRRSGAIEWDRLSAEKIAATPPLQELSR